MTKLTAIQQAMTAAFPGAVLETDYAQKGFVLDVSVPSEKIVDAVSIVDAQGFFIETITGVDWLGEQAAILKEAEAKAAAVAAAKAKAQAAKAAEETGEAVSAPKQEAAQVSAEPVKEVPSAASEVSMADELEVVYDFNAYDEFCRVVIRTRVPRDKPELPTISTVYPAAHWHERETHDFFGIKFVGHPYLVPLLLPEDADFHPLLKDFNK